MLSDIRTIHDQKRPGYPSLLIIFVTNITVTKAENYNCDVSDFFQRSPEFAAIDCEAVLYQYPVSIDDGFRWQDLLDWSSELLELLHTPSVRNRDEGRPLVFIGEGLGGLIIKQALWKARERLYRYRDLLEQISGVIFLVTPHLGKDNAETGTKLATILQQYSKSAAQRAARRELLKSYQICCLRFEELGLKVPVLSTYETEGSRSRVSRLSGRKSPLVVDQNFATTNALHEELLGLDLPLRRILDLKTPSQTRARIIQFIVDLHGEARTRLLNVLLESGPGAQIRIPTMRSPTSAPSIIEMPTQTNSNQRSSSSSQDPVLLTPPGHSSSTPLSRSAGVSPDMDLVANMATLVVDARNVRLPCHFIRPHARNRELFPRPDVLSLIESALLPSERDLDQPEQKLKTFVLCGMGGLGKTEIAIEFLFSHIKEFDAVFVFHADQASTLAEEYSRAAIQLGIQQNATADPRDSRELLKDWFADPQKFPAQSYHSTEPSDDQCAKWLIIFDNADDPDVLSDYWPTAGVGSILVTSRDPMSKSAFFFGDTGHELGTISIPDGADWVMRLSEADISDRKNVDAAHVISKRLDGLPLAITQITSIIRMRQLRLPEFIDLYDSETELAELQSTRIGNRRGYEHSLASVWALGSLEPRPMALLGVISMLDPDGIQEDLLKASVLGTYGLPYLTKPREYHHDLTPLLQSSLIQRNSANSELRVHRLVTDVVRQKLQETGCLVDTFNLAVDLTCAVWPFWRLGAKAGATHDISRWEQSGKLYPHVFRLFERFPLIKEQFDSSKYFGKFADLIHEAAWYQYERSNFDDVDPLLDLAESIYSEIEPRKYEELSIIRAAKCSILHWKNDGEASLIEAEKCLELSKLSCLQTGRESMELSYAWYRVGMSTNLCKLYSQAIPYFEETKKIRQNLPGFTPVDQLGAFYQTALSLYGQGLIEECETLLRHALKVWEDSKGTNDKSSFRPAHIYFTLGHVYGIRGIMDDSYQWHTRALNHLVGTVGDNHIYTAHPCVAVAEHAWRRGEYQDAARLLDQALRTYKKHPGFREDLAKVYFYLGRLLSMDEANASKAAEMLSSAAACLDAIYPHTRHRGGDLTAAMFDGLGTFGLS